MSAGKRLGSLKERRAGCSGFRQIPGLAGQSGVRPDGITSLAGFSGISSAREINSMTAREVARRDAKARKLKHKWMAEPES